MNKLTSLLTGISIVVIGFFISFSILINAPEERFSQVASAACEDPEDCGECNDDSDCPTDGANCSEAVSCGSPGLPWSRCRIWNDMCPEPPPPPNAPGPCEDGTDNDDDGYTDYADPGCTSSSGITEAQGPWPRFVNVSVTASEYTSWQISCPPNGSYNTACPYVSHDGTSSNDQFAGEGDYSVYADNATINGDPNPSYSQGGTVGSLQVHDDFNWEIEVGPPVPPAATVDILCNGSQGPCTVAYGSTVTLSWSSANATSCTASNGWTGAKATSGSEGSSTITGTTTFTLTCSGDGGAGNDSVVVQNPANNPPVTSSVRATEPNYCTSAPSAFVEWTYSDPDGHPQQYYQVQVDDTADFSSPVIDTLAVSCEACRSYLSPATLAFNTLHYARVRTWDNPTSVSPWATMTLCSGSGCQAGNTSWRTPQHAYPSNIDFSWTPSNASVNQVVQFTNTAICYALGNTPAACASWAWTFGDGGTGVLSNPTHTYTSEGSFPVTFSVTDAQGYTCPQGTPLTKTISIQKKIPVWKEVAPR